MAIGCLGDIVFEVNDDHIRTFSGMTYDTGARYTTHNRIGGEPLLEFTGEDVKKISLNVRLLASHGVNPQKEMDKLVEDCDNGKPLRFVLGKKQFGKYKWVITQVKNKLQHIDNKGNIFDISVSLTLQSYAER